MQKGLSMQFSFSIRNAALAAALLAMAATAAYSQQGTAPAGEPPSAPSAQAPAPSVQAPVPDPVFPTPDPKNFNADSPTVDTVNAFLKQTWGFDPNRVWQVEQITKTAAPGVVKVSVAVAEKGQKDQQGMMEFFVTPDGKHIIANGILPFGPKPYEEHRQLLVEKATGPARGAPSKDLLLVEFADFQCPYCKEAQPTIQKLLQDFPNAHFVYENFPLAQHTEAPKAAQYSVCVAKQAGDDAFYKFSDAVFENQSALTPTGSDKALKDAVTKIGLDPAKIEACSATPEAKAVVEASKSLAVELDVPSTPTLYVNGRGISLGGTSYENLKQIVAYQATLDGVSVAPKPPTLGKP
jgi:protein-disulfide isomerase